MYHMDEHQGSKRRRGREALGPMSSVGDGAEDDRLQRGLRVLAGIIAREHLKNIESVIPPSQRTPGEEKLT